MAQTSHEARQVTIDSLRAVLALNQKNDTIAGRLAPEIKVLFPQIKDLAVSRAIFGNMSTGVLDTVNVALVSYTTTMPADKRHELERYLAARLQLAGIRLVDVGNISGK